MRRNSVSRLKCSVLSNILTTETCLFKIFFSKVAGGVMIAVGIYAKVAKENGTELPLSHELPFSTCYIHSVLLELSLQKVSCFTDVVDTLATDPALLLLTVGSLTFIITFFGCFGALRDGAILLKMVRRL